MRALLAEQVTLIKSIPLDAAQRVHEWTLAGIEDGTRAKEVAAQILRTNEVSANRAMLIARTETARTSSKLTESRARHVGSEGYIWRTSRDSDVRDSHREMEGKIRALGFAADPRQARRPCRVPPELPLFPRANNRGRYGLTWHAPRSAHSPGVSHRSRRTR
jgi:SPP1 gp7 family putative phage head morphogenesis protein